MPRSPRGERCLSASYPLHRSFKRLGLTYSFDNSSTEVFSTASRSLFQNLAFRGFAGPNALTSIGIEHQFSLTPGDRATFTSFFNVQPVPEPTSLSLLAIGGP